MTVTKRESRMVADNWPSTPLSRSRRMEPVRIRISAIIIIQPASTRCRRISLRLRVHLKPTQVEIGFPGAFTNIWNSTGTCHSRCSFLTEARFRFARAFLAARCRQLRCANFLVWETGSSIISNGAIGDLTQTFARRTHVSVLASIREESFPTLMTSASCSVSSRLQPPVRTLSVYTTFSTGPRRPGDVDGPENYHVVILDNGRSSMLGTSFQEMLRCIRCGACMNHCPVYHAVGGHAYGWVYPGPMGAVLTPSLIGVDKGGHLPNASTFCGRCESVCPVRIPLPKMMRHWREREFERHLSPATVRAGLSFWGYFAKRPSLYRFTTRLAMGTLGWLGRIKGQRKGRFSCLPLLRRPATAKRNPRSFSRRHRVV